MSKSKKKSFDELSLEYHHNYPPGKIEVKSTKPLATQYDLSLAYSPGVAVVSSAIATDPSKAADYTSRGNLVGVISNGTAVLGLGAIGPLASKPVMEGKAVLFKKFANIDVFDIEIDQSDPEKLIETIAALEPTFGGINLEDIKAPECFIVEKALRARLDIPVFHDDQHGTAIIVSAATINGLLVVDKDIADIKLVVAGAGAAALSCISQLIALGLKKENVTIVDLDGVVYEGRTKGMDEYKAAYAQNTDARTLNDAIFGADMFLGLSTGGVLKPDMLKRMAERPLVFALANPEPEIDPGEARTVRRDAVIATGRSDYPNQVNNVLCFPYLFRGALDVGATTINDKMKHACIIALAELARVEDSEVAANAYGGNYMKFGAGHLIPRPFDPRLMIQIAPAVARAAMESGVATRPLTDLAEYQQELTNIVFKSGNLMKTIFERARFGKKQRLVFAEGEDRRVLQATQQVVDQDFAQPILIGRPNVISERINELGLRIVAEQDFEIINPDQDDRLNKYWNTYHDLFGRDGITPAFAKTEVRSNNTIIAALLVHLGDADCMVCGSTGRFRNHLKSTRRIIGLRKDVNDYSAMVTLILPSGTFFLVDTHITHTPTPLELVEMTLFASNKIREFGIVPKAAILSHSNFGSHNCDEAERLRIALKMIREQMPELEIDGEMHSDAALSQTIRGFAMPDSSLHGSANLFIFPNMDSANISYNFLKMLGGGVMVGPLLLGAAKPVHIVTNATSVRGLLNVAAVAVTEAQNQT